MLNKKMFRDILQNKSQFITIFLMILIGVMVYVGIEAYMQGMINAADNFYTKNNLQDLNVIGTNLTKEDLNNIKSINHVQDAERKLVVTGVDALDKDKTYLMSFIESNNISKFYIIDGEKFDVNKHGVWLDNFYAEKNKLKVGDTIKIKYDSFILKEKILGLINVPDHIYDVKDESELIPDRTVFGFVYLSYKEIPQDYIENNLVTKLGLESSDDLSLVIPNYNYEDYIPFNYIMVDLDSKDYKDEVKASIEDNIDNAFAIINIEDTASYLMYQGEIDEGKSYVGIFSGLFLFIALLSVVTTMTRVVKKQRLQIGTLKALGFSKHKITLHYISYGFYLALLASIAGILLGRYFIGSVFLGLEMSFFEVPNGVPVIDIKSYLVALIVIIVVCLITYLTCVKELRKKPAESLRTELPKVKNGSLNITAKGIFKKMKFSSKWNLRDIIRNKFRTITGVFGIVGCCTLIVCAFGMLNSMNHFINLQFEDLYNFNYKLTIKSDIKENELEELIKKYKNSTSQTLGIEIMTNEGKREQNTIFVTDAKDLVRFQDKDDKFIKLDSNKGVYVTYKLASTYNYKIGDKIKWHVYGNSTYYESTIIGFNKDPQNQNITMTRAYMESLGLDYKPDSLYTKSDLSNVKEIKGIELISNKDSLKNSMQSMLSMMKKMILLIIVFANLLGAVIIYNMGILSYNEKQYQFSTLKVLGFSDSKIKKIFIQQNIWITTISIIIGLPSGYYLTSWLFKTCLDDNFDFGVHINISTYLIAIIGTYLVSYLVSLYLSKKIKKIDLVSSLKMNE